MTQDAQKFTEEDTKKASQLCGNAGHVDNNSLCDFCRPIANALRDERKGLEGRVRELESRWNESENKRAESDNAWHQNQVRILTERERAYDRLKALEAENGEFQMRVMELATENAQLKAEVEKLSISSLHTHNKAIEAELAKLTAERDAEIKRARDAESRVKVLEEMEREVLSLTHPNIKHFSDRLNALEEELKVERLINIKRYPWRSKISELETRLLESQKEVEGLRYSESQWRGMWERLKASDISFHAKYDEASTRLAEAVRVIEEIEDAREEHGDSLNFNWLCDKLQAFLSSPTNSEAQDRQRAKDRLIASVGENFGGVNLPSKENAGKYYYLVARINDVRDKWVALQALDSLPSEARVCVHDKGGVWEEGHFGVLKRDHGECPFCKKCEHDEGRYWLERGELITTMSRSKREYEDCPLCDKKTGGV